MLNRIYSVTQRQEEVWSRNFRKKCTVSVYTQSCTLSMRVVHQGRYKRLGDEILVYLKINTRKG